MGSSEVLRLGMPGTDAFPHLVRIKRRNSHGFVEFEFSLGDPELFLEMILAPSDFREFCRAKRVRFLPPRSEETAPAGEA